MAFGNWKPSRFDAVLVGRISPHVFEYLEPFLDVTEVYQVPETWLHIVERHGGEYDVNQARKMIASILEAPLLVYRSRHLKGALLFAGDYDGEHLLIVVVKILKESGENWLSTLYIDRSSNVEKRARKGGVLFRASDRQD